MAQIKQDYEKAVEVKDLKKYYGSVKAVDGVSFYIKKSQVFTLLGPNGAGKTTIVEILEGLKEADSGQLFYFEKKCNRVTAAQKERIGVLLQDNNFIEKIKVKEMISMFASFFARSLPVKQILKQVALEEKANSFAEDLSGGQRQRLAIGLALVNDPEIVYLDEPTTGLDPQARRNVWDLINNLKAEGKTIFLTTHYMEEAEQLSDYIYIMDHGKIISRGTPASLISELDRENIIEFDRGQIEEELLEELKVHFSRINQTDERITLYVEDLPDAMSNLLAIGKEKDFQFDNMIFRQPNLEDVFLELTGKGLRD